MTVQFYLTLSLSILNTFLTLFNVKVDLIQLRNVDNAYNIGNWQILIDDVTKRLERSIWLQIL